MATFFWGTTLAWGGTSSNLGARQGNIPRGVGPDSELKKNTKHNLEQKMKHYEKL